MSRVRIPDGAVEGTNFADLRAVGLVFLFFHKKAIAYHRKTQLERNLKMGLLLNYLGKYKKYVVLQIVGALCFAAAELGLPTVTAGIINEGILKDNKGYIYQSIWIMLAVCLIGGIGNVIMAYCSARVSTNVVRDMRKDLTVKSQEFSHTEYNKFGVSSLITRTTSDAYVLMQFLNLIFRSALLTPLMLVISMIMVVRTNVSLSLVIGACIPIIAVGVYLLATTSSPLSDGQQTAMDQINRIMRENLTGLRVIRAFRKDKYETERFSDISNEYAGLSKRLFKIISSGQPIFFFLLHMAVIVVFIISSRLIDVGSLQVGDLVAFHEYMFHAMYSMLLFSMVFVMYPRAAVSARRIREVLDAEPLIRNPENPVMEGDGSGTLCFDHVTFGYPDSEESILHDVSFEAKKGETIAFIGSTGSGKSSLINLVPRFYDVTSGSIRIDGVDVKDYDLAVLRKKIGFIPQKSLLFSGSINENIKYGKQDARHEEVEHSTKVAQAYQFILDKPQQFMEPVEEGGSNLSGGQKQRLSIARAIVRKADIYVFDDSFSALDFKTDAKLRKKLKDETKDSITLIVAQRITSIIDATKIVVLNEGKLIAQGTHTELLKTCQIYQEIAGSQLSKEELSV